MLTVVIVVGYLIGIAIMCGVLSQLPDGDDQNLVMAGGLMWPLMVLLLAAVAIGTLTARITRRARR